MDQPSTGLAVTATGLRKSYGDLEAVAGVDLALAHGECVALLGPNGAGKTTTTEILAGYRRRDSGEVKVLGEDPSHASRAWRARVGIVLQSVHDLGDLTVAESVRHFAGYYPTPRDPDEVIEAVGLSAKARERASRLSGGQRRRLDVALGIIGRPDLLFLDEPTTGFDPEARHEFWELVMMLRREGTTILLTTHYLEEAEALADRVVVINRGTVVAQGDPRTLGGRQAELAHVTWLEDGHLRKEATATPTALVAELAGRFGGEIPELGISRPTLEDIYLSLVDGNSRKEMGQ